MTGYEQFVANPHIEPGKISLLWELEIDGKIDDLIEFCREFLKQKGFIYTGYSKENFRAIFNNKYIFAGAVQDGKKLAIRINQL